MEREVGEGIGTGNTCKPMAVSFQCMTKFATKKRIKEEISKKKKKKVHRFKSKCSEHLFSLEAGISPSSKTCMQNSGFSSAIILI